MRVDVGGGVFEKEREKEARRKTVALSWLEVIGRNGNVDENAAASKSVER